MVLESSTRRYKIYQFCNRQRVTTTRVVCKKCNAGKFYSTVPEMIEAVGRKHTCG